MARLLKEGGREGQGLKCLHRLIDCSQEAISTMPKGIYPKGFDQLLRGDIIKVGGNLRKVRHVSRSGKKTKGGALPEGLVRYVYVAIQKRSWTNRCYTMLSRPELHDRFEGIVKRGVSCRTTETEARVQDAVEASVTGETNGWENTEIANAADGKAVI